MYLVAKGELQVAVGDEKDRKSNKVNEKLLRPGQYFGEISLVYGCKRTAKVFAKKYCTLAMLTKEKFTEVTKQFPSLLEELQKGIYEYSDRMLRFIKRSIIRVPYFENLSDE
jgi:CRP-like cAMP-binding protein